ncbi:uncharacterized protein LOC126834994 [Adelges cooleyi]|uniref:uncharacterized protein LOC126834994 n=1 Tax=Adelges cooleyi TaxID=133065 RepID=UPI00218030FF|nr:uncharacterized protein LOC126834994 [Adelges cooleyi]
MIKLFAFLAVCCVAATVVDVQAAPSKYTTKFDNVNVDEILNNDRLLNSYFKCLMDQGKCTPEGEELKRWIPDAMDNNCKDCSEKQRQGAEKIIKFMAEKKKDMWKKLEEKYDPDGTFRERYKDEAKRLNIEILEFLSQIKNNNDIMFYCFVVVLCVVRVPAALCGPFPQQQAQNGSPQSVQQSGQQPVQQPVQQNIQQPSQQPAQQSGPQPAQQPGQQPIQQINQQHPGQHLGQNGLPQSGEQQPDYRQNEQKQAIERFSHNLVANPRIRKNYLMCFLDHGPCSPDAQNLKPEVLPDAIREECTHCTDLQKKVIEKMMCYLNNHQPQILRQVAAKFDPQGDYMKQYISALEKKQNEELQKQQQLPVESTTPVTTTTTTKKP